MQNTTTGSTDFNEAAQRATDKAEQTLVSTRRAADAALDSLQAKVSHLASVAPSTLSRVAAQVDDLTHRSVQRALAAKEAVTEQAVRAGDRTVSYVRDEPVKSMLMAAAAGACLAALIAAVSRPRSSDRH